MYLYLGGILLMTIIAIVVQCKFKPKTGADRENYDDEAEAILSKYKSLGR